MDKRARVFNIPQYNYHPYEGYVSQDSDEPKPNSKPLLTQAAIDAGLSTAASSAGNTSCTTRTFTARRMPRRARKKGYGIKADDHKHRHGHVVLQCRLTTIPASRVMFSGQSET